MSSEQDVQYYYDSSAEQWWYLDTETQEWLQCPEEEQEAGAAGYGDGTGEDAEGGHRKRLSDDGSNGVTATGASDERGTTSSGSKSTGGSPQSRLDVAKGEVGSSVSKETRAGKNASSNERTKQHIGTNDVEDKLRLLSRRSSLSEVLGSSNATSNELSGALFSTLQRRDSISDVLERLKANTNFLSPNVGTAPENPSIPTESIRSVRRRSTGFAGGQGGAVRFGTSEFHDPNFQLQLRTILKEPHNKQRDLREIKEDEDEEEGTGD